MDTSEEMLIANKFMQNSDLDVEKMGNLLYIRKVAAKTTNKLANNTTALDAESLTFEADTETAVSVSPQFAYSAAAFNEDVKQRLMAFPKLEKAVKQQFVRSMTAQIDADAGGLGDGLSNTVSDTNLSAALIRQALGTLRTNAQREYKTGKVGSAVLRIHPSQQQHLYGIPEINNAELRGDGDNPNVTGLLVKAWGCDVDISGNIESSGGNRQNLLFIKQAFALLYNAEPQLQAPYQDGLATVVIGFCDYGVVEVYDAYAVSVRTVA
jgi:hypothetical protein